MKTILTKFFLIVLLFTGYSLVFAEADAELMLRSPVTSANKDQEITVEILLKNPNSQNIISVRSWLEYDPQVLQAFSIDTKNTLFTLSAPGEDEVSEGEGLVKIGRSNISGGVKAGETVVATVKFKVLSSADTMATIGFYDYQISELGHTSVNIVEEGFPLNILAKEPEELKIQLNAGVLPPVETPSTPPPAVTPPLATDNFPPIGGGPIQNNLQRPTDLRANTGSGYVDLAWKAPVDPYRTGFNIYYGKTSGQYSRRRSVGNVSSFRLDGLMNGETYYLAVTAYDQMNQESDYSNEVGIIVNQPLSSTHPFEGLLDQLLGRLPSQPQNGPLFGWLVFSSLGLGGAMVYGRKRK